MAVNAYKSTIVTNLDASPSLVSDTIETGGRIKEAIATDEVVSGDSVGSTFRMLRVWSGWRVSELLIDSDDIGTTTTTDVGLYDISATNSGAVVDADFFASALSLKDGALAKTDITHESAVVDAADYGKALWEQLGLSSDPNKWYDLTMTLTGAADAGGTVTLRCRYVDGS